MQLVLERRAERSAVIAVASPLIAIALTLVTMAILFAIIGKNPLDALWVYFIEPLTDRYSLQEIAVKATPLVMIAVGLSLCYIANVWNIGAEGQFLVGAVCGSWLAVRTNGTDVGPLGAAGHAGAGRARRRALRADPGDLQGVFRRQRNPHQPDAGLCRRFRHGLSGARALARSARLEFPDHRRVRSGRHRADPDRRRPRCTPASIIALIVVMLATVLLGRTIMGFEIRLVGAAPRAARFSGFNADQLVLFTFAVSGALAGLAGIIEVAGPVGHLQPGISPGYGFTAIIVAFLGRLNPVGILIAGLFLALTFIGGEEAQIAMKVPLDLTKVFQGILLFYVLACDSLIVYRIRLVRTLRKARACCCLKPSSCR